MPIWEGTPYKKLSASPKRKFPEGLYVFHIYGNSYFPNKKFSWEIGISQSRFLQCKFSYFPNENFLGK